MIYSLLGFYLNWRAYNVFGEGHPRRWEVTLNSCSPRILITGNIVVNGGSVAEWLGPVP